MKRLLGTVLCLLSLCFAASAQSETSPAEFEVASIRPAAPDARGMWVRTSPGGRVNITNMTLKELIVIAWRIQPFQISGGPPWIDSLRYDIAAKPETRPQGKELSGMLQSLLQDRFQLKIRRETKELPVYALVIAKKDGTLGPGMTEAKEGSCTTYDAANPPPRPESGQAACARMRRDMMGRTEWRAVSVPMDNLIYNLSRTLKRTVVNKTGLSGKYDVKLDWKPDEALATPLPPDALKLPPSGDPDPSIFTAIREQLGLKLESQKGPVEIFIVERAEKPSEN